jgi:ABC-type glycerol-3-phosphate transport system substrate-binding protein
VLLWNKDLFAASALDPETPPASLEELTDYANLLTKFGPTGTLEQLGFLPVLSTTQTSLFVRMFGDYWVSDNGLKITVNSPQVEEALLWEQQFYFKYNYENVTAIFPNAISLDSNEHPFYTNELAMMIANWDQVSPDFIANHNQELNFGVAPIPPTSSFALGPNPVLVDGAVLIVPARAPNPDHAIELLQALTTEDILPETAQYLGQFPAGPTALVNSTFQANQNTPVLVDILETSQGVTAHTTPLSPELESALLQIGELVLYRGVDPAPLLNQVQSEFAPRLDQNIDP